MQIGESLISTFDDAELHAHNMLNVAIADPPTGLDNLLSEYPECKERLHLNWCRFRHRRNNVINGRS